MSGDYYDENPDWSLHPSHTPPGAAGRSANDWINRNWNHPHDFPLRESAFLGDPLQWATPQVRHWSGIKQVTFFIAACIGSWVAFGAVCVCIYAAYLAVRG